MDTISQIWESGFSNYWEEFSEWIFFGEVNFVKREQVSWRVKMEKDNYDSINGSKLIAVLILWVVLCGIALIVWLGEIGCMKSWFLKCSRVIKCKRFTRKNKVRRFSEKTVW